MSVIEVRHLTKEYQLGHLTSLREAGLNLLGRLAGRPSRQRERFRALDDVNFTIEEGEVVGIIGHNGAGKSTLLKHLANISKPTSGEVVVRGSVAPLIEVGAGLSPELSGRENIFLNAAILGIPRRVIRQKFDEIVDFSELEQFIDTPVKRYSSGMTVRLGFAIATSMDADILIVDEVLAVGDLAFQRKCFDRMEELIKRRKKTVLLVSHNIRQVERICSRTLLMNHGRVSHDGPSAEVCSHFYTQSDKKILSQNERSTTVHESGEVELTEIGLLDVEGHRTDTVEHGMDVTVQLKVRVFSTLVRPLFGVGIHTTDLLYLATEISEDIFADSILTPGDYTIRLQIRRFPLLPASYSLRVGISAGEVNRPVFYAENLHQFLVVISGGRHHTQSMREGFLSLESEWELIAPSTAGLSPPSTVIAPLYDSGTLQ